MLADGEVVGDGSWNLTIYVTDLNEKRTMVVKGDMHIGGVMLKLTESFENLFALTGFIGNKSNQVIPVGVRNSKLREGDSAYSHSSTRPSRKIC
ncbi:Fermitin family-like 2 [Papilio machaon]|uniref:Fermitin family-like 2 n=1 Tax=Papilio machaon TaxID=76193 RepID=A0A194RL45_PAPMA|nr:Fermitin family-like 2 [Papilio machaon]